MELDTLFEQIIMLPQRTDLSSINMANQHHVEVCIASDLEKMTFTMECFMGLDDSLTPTFHVDFEGTNVLNYPLMDGESTSKTIEFFKQMKLNTEHYVDSLHNVNRYTLIDLIKEVEENVDDVL
mgnify:CR=1 FL=1|tara:strand:- start:203 stop:574 length:372 start_codon:yes stop_codon:yes gene_type:complete